MRAYIIADNQFITQLGISSLVKEVSQAEVILYAHTKAELQKHLNSHSKAVVILDYTLFDFISVEQLLIQKSAFQESSWLVYSDDMGEHSLRWMLTNDDSISVIAKHDSKELITEALQSLSRGVPYVCQSVLQLIQDSTPPESNPSVEKLTLSEKSILKEIAAGKTTKEIAFDKNLSFHTVNSHRKNIFRKLEINNVHEAVRYAIRAGIFDVAEYYI